MEAERKNTVQQKDTFISSEEIIDGTENSGSLATCGIFFQCPMIGKYFLKF